MTRFRANFDFVFGPVLGQFGPEELHTRPQHMASATLLALGAMLQLAFNAWRAHSQGSVQLLNSYVQLQQEALKLETKCKAFEYAMWYALQEELKGKISIRLSKRQSEQVFYHGFVKHADEPDYKFEQHEWDRAKLEVKQDVEKMLHRESCNWALATSLWKALGFPVQVVWWRESVRQVEILELRCSINGPHERPQRQAVLRGLRQAWDSMFEEEMSACPLANDFDHAMHIQEFCFKDLDKFRSACLDGLWDPYAELSRSLNDDTFGEAVVQTHCFELVLREFVTFEVSISSDSSSQTDSSTI